MKKTEARARRIHLPASGGALSLAPVYMRAIERKPRDLKRDQSRKETERVAEKH